MSMDELQRRVARNLEQMRDSDYPWQWWRFAAKIAELGRDNHLTRSELRALNHASHGLSCEMAAQVAGVGKQTMASQLKAARGRLQAKNTTHACCIALRKGLIT